MLGWQVTESDGIYLLFFSFSVAALPSADNLRAQHPPLLRCSTRPAPRTLTEAAGS